MSLIDRKFHVVGEADSLGLSCSSNGVTLAGVPLLRAASFGFVPRPANEIGLLMKQAYEQDVDPSYLTPGLHVIAEALNRNDLGRAMVATMHLRLPPLSKRGAIRIAQTDKTLAKYDPNEPRDERGRWTAGDGSATSLSVDATSPREDLKPTLVGRRGPRSQASIVCEAAARQCIINSLKDEKNGRSPYFNACQKSEDTCEFVVMASRFTPDLPVIMKFPDNTILEILDGTATMIYLSGNFLETPLR